MIRTTEAALMIEHHAEKAERRSLRFWSPTDTSDPRQWKQFRVMLKLRKLRARWNNTQAYKLRTAQ